MKGSISLMLGALKEGPATMSGLAEKLALDEGEVRSILDILVSLGFVQELTEGCSGCAGGPCSDCPVKNMGAPTSRTYVLTRKGQGLPE